jgi:hypothetical protein
MVSIKVEANDVPSSIDSVRARGNGIWKVNFREAIVGSE